MKAKELDELDEARKEEKIRNLYAELETIKNKLSALGENVSICIYI